MFRLTLVLCQSLTSKHETLKEIKMTVSSTCLTARLSWPETHFHDANDAIPIIRSLSICPNGFRFGHTVQKILNSLPSVVIWEKKMFVTNQERCSNCGLI